MQDKKCTWAQCPVISIEMKVGTRDMDSVDKCKCRQMSIKGIEWMPSFFITTNADMTTSCMGETEKNRKKVNRDNYDYRRKESAMRKGKSHYLVLCRSGQCRFRSCYWTGLSRLTKLVAAAAVARSGFPLMLRAEARGSAVPAVVGLWDDRLAGLDGGRPLTVECRLPATPLTGELPEGSRLRLNGPVFNVLAGGSGSGRAPELVPRCLEGEFKAAYIRGRVVDLMPVINSCLSAS